LTSSSNKTLVAHLGAHKTATSLVQGYFKEKSKYYAKQGVCFLTRSDVSPYISWGQKVVKDAEKFNAYIKTRTDTFDGSYVLLSNENAIGRPFGTSPGLYPGHDKIIPHFVRAFDGFEPRIVYSIRPQWEYIESYYLQLVHQGYFNTFYQFLDEIDLDALQWNPIIDKFRAEFGRENVVVMDFGKIRQGQDVFLKEFIERALSPEIVPDLDYDVVHNASISDRGLEMALRVNPLLKKGETGVVRRFLQEHFSNLTEPRPNLLAEHMKVELKARYADEYAALVSGE